MEGAGEAAIVRRAREGDAEAFRELFDRHGRTVFRVACRLTGNPNLAEDVVQDTFLKAWQNLATFDERAEFSTWLYRIAVNASLDGRRRAGRRSTREAAWPIGADEVAFDPPAIEPDPERRAQGAQVVAAIREGFGELSDLERSAFVLRHFEGESIARLGAVLGLEDSAAKHAVFRAVKKLRRVLEPHRI